MRSQVCNGRKNSKINKQQEQQQQQQQQQLLKTENFFTAINNFQRISFRFPISLFTCFARHFYSPSLGISLCIFSRFFFIA